MEKVYVKFIPVNVCEEFDENREKLEKLKEWCKFLDRNGFAPKITNEKGVICGSLGNASYRVKPKRKDFIITPSGNDLGEDNPRFLLVSDVDYKGGKVFYKGPKDLKPSSETMVHDLIYRMRPNVNAILHGHSKEITENASKIGVTETTKFEEYGTKELVERVAEVLASYPQEDFFQMRGHGFLSCGNSLDEAGRLLVDVCKRYSSLKY